MINKDISSGVLSDGFLPAMLFPGIKMEQANFNAWKNFWLQEKKSDFKSSLIKIGEKTGFTADAFNPLKI
ncbi:MAG: hypothetical protein B6I31_02460 [Desulfobacteraceae bacterium 4572_19]|nr:MAG: hypothetical protein B6I31_02460 [Desulfobacteraceae bacterium 4572_19]